MIVGTVEIRDDGSVSEYLEMPQHVKADPGRKVVVEYTDDGWKVVSVDEPLTTEQAKRLLDGGPRGLHEI